jgi:hypothetical protein
LNERFRQLHKDVERDDEELARTDQLIRAAEEAKREMDKPITG